MLGAIFSDGHPVHPDRCRSVAMVAAVTCLALVSCDRREMDEIGEPDTPFVLLLSPVHAEDLEAMAASAEDLEAMAAFLSEESGLAVDVRVAESEDHAITSAGTHFFDAYLLPLFDYLFCRQEYDVEAGLQVLRHGDQRTYRGDILVRDDSEMRELSDLAGRSIAFVDRYSVSGFLYPAALLRDADISVESTFAGTHKAAIAELVAGRVDAAATYHGAAAESDHLRTIATTDEIPNEPVFFRDELDDEMRIAFSDALIQYAGTNEGQRVLAAIAQITGFVAVDDAYYRDVHEAISAAEQSVHDLVPRGWLLHAENQRTLDLYAP